LVRVILPTDCGGFVLRETVLDLPATTIAELLAGLDRLYPGLGAFADQRMAFAIDGVIHQDAHFTPLAPEDEVALIPKIGGG